MHWIRDRISYINVTLVFPDTGYNVSDWGTVVIDGHEIWVDSKIEQWIDHTLPVIIEEHHTYDIGSLEEGKYNFSFKVWGESIKNITFTISKPVGGFVIPINKLELLMPYIGVISVIMVTMTVVVKYKKKIYELDQVLRKT